MSTFQGQCPICHQWFETDENAVGQQSCCPHCKNTIVVTKPLATLPATVPDCSPTVTKMDWFVCILAMCIPVVNIVMMFIWAFDNTKPSRANFFKVYLIIALISMVFCVLIAVILFAIGISHPEFLNQ